jgi:chemotaxis protein histidine kinase CheA
MDIASLRAKLDNIAEELAQLPEQETVAIEEEEIEEAHHMMPKTLQCEECGDMLGCPTTDCECDSMDPKGDNWIMVDVDNDGDMDMAMANEEDLSEFSPADMKAADKDNKAIQKSGSGMKSTSAAKPQAAGTLAQRLKTEEVEEEEAVEEEAVEEATVEVPVQELADLMQLAGYANYAERIEEYANEPDEQYMDAEEQLIGLSGGLNGPKTMHTPAAGGDNPMDKEALKTVEENLYKSYKDFLEEAEITEQD